MFTLLKELLAEYNDVRHFDAKPATSKEPPKESDLTDDKSFKLFVKSFPALEKQLKLAWNGDIKAMARGEHRGSEGEGVYVFPKLLKPSNLKKYDSSFTENQMSMRTVDELYKLFFAKFHVANKTRREWFEAKKVDAAQV